jgi:hypothetical protein
MGGLLFGFTGGSAFGNRSQGEYRKGQIKPERLIYSRERCDKDSILMKMDRYLAKNGNHAPSTAALGI